jgi:uncharacterized membrane protein YphA (DoxX/SURF4 family)
MSKTRNILLWIAQGLLAASFIWASYMKLFQPVKVSAMWPWTGQVAPALLIFTALTDLAGGIGLLIPKTTRIAAFAIILLMICASIFHMMRGEGVVPNIIFALLAAFIAWGRSVPRIQR